MSGLIDNKTFPIITKSK